MTTKILALTDALGDLARFVSCPASIPWLPRSSTIGLHRRQCLRQQFHHERGAKIVVSRHPRRASPLSIDAEIYKWRHLIENFFGKLKEFKRVAMRADKTDQSFAANILLAAAIMNSR